MKKNLFFAALALLAAVSCQKTNPTETAVSGPQGQLIVRLGEDPATKVSDAAMKENQINSVQFFVFTENGSLETDLYKTGSGTSYSLTTGIGDKVVYAIVNAPRLKHTSISSLEGDLSDLSHNKVAATGVQSSLVMSGKASVHVDEYKAGSTTPAQCTVYVKKLASAIQLATISTSFAGSTLEGSTFTIKEIYVKNVVGKAPYGVQSEVNASSKTTTGLPMVLTDDQRRTPAYWYNKTKLDQTPLPVTYDLCNLGPVTSTAFAVNRTLYVYPNATVKDPDVKGGTPSEFDPRPTRLVIHALISTSADHYDKPFKDKDYYYTFDLPVLEANKKYKVGVVISMLGKTNDNDDSKTSPGLAQPTITVLDWDQTIELNYQY